MKLDNFDKFKTKEPHLVKKHISYLPAEYQEYLLQTIADAAYKRYEGFTFDEESDKDGDLYVVGFNYNHEIGAVYLTAEDLKRAFDDVHQGKSYS